MNKTENQWITDRLPEQEDADDYDRVMIYSELNSSNWESLAFHYVREGEPWHPFPTMPALEESENLTTKQ